MATVNKDARHDEKLGLFEMDEDELEKTIHKDFNRLRGRLIGLIEGWGMPDKQEAGMKSTLKLLTYGIEADLIEHIFGEE